MKTQYEMLLELKDRYGVHIGKKSFTNLMLYMNGYSRCLAEMFAGKENNILTSFDFSDFVLEFCKIDTHQHNWSQILLFYSHTDSNAFDVFYEVLDLYLKKNPNFLQTEQNRQNKYHNFQLNLDLEKIEPTNDYFTSAKVIDMIDPEWLKQDY